MMLPKRILAALVLFIGVEADIPAGNGVSNPSRDALFSFYDKPSDVRTITETRTGAGALEVEICTDECDLFTLPSEARSATFWDMILLFKAYLSPRAEDAEFGSAHAKLVHEVLAKYSPKACADMKDEKQRVNCTVASVARNIRLEYAFVRYDEGSRCLAFKRIDDLSKVIKGGCTKVK